MSHVRNFILGKVAEALRVSPANWNRVFLQRIMPARVVETFLMVYFESEDTSNVLLHFPKIYQGLVQFRVDAVLRVSDPEALEITVGNVAEEIQTKLVFSALQGLAPQVQDLVLLNTGVSIEEEQRTFAVLTQVWQFTYHVGEGAPSV